MLSPTCFSKKILAWFERFGRHDLPWQHPQTPYRVWISEIMLQQTQVTTVIPYFKKFMRSFPTVKALASADENDVLSHWSGLGYYARARNLHKAAKVLHKKFRGRIPKTIDELTQLPGIGRSTAGAIVSLGHKQRAAILDGNVKRVLARCFLIEGWPGINAVAQTLWEISERYTPESRSDDYNQAMMDLGATLCTRTKPKCGLCPLVADCQAHQQGRETDFPTSKPKADRPTRETTMLLLLDNDNRILLERRPPSGIWGGLWCLPNVDADDYDLIECERRFGCKVLHEDFWPSFDHQFSHFRLIIKPLLLNVHSVEHRVMEADSQIWYKTDAKLPGGIPAPIAQLIRKVSEHVANRAL